MIGTVILDIVSDRVWKWCLQAGCSYSPFRSNNWHVNVLDKGKQPKVTKFFGSSNERGHKSESEEDPSPTIIPEFPKYLDFQYKISALDSLLWAIKFSELV